MNTRPTNTRPRTRGAYVFFHDSGEVSTVFRNKRRILRELKRRPNVYGQLRRIPWTYYAHSGDPYGWDYPTFRAQSSLIWERERPPASGAD